MEKNAKIVPFFYKDRKRTQRSERSFEKNACPTLIWRHEDLLSKEMPNSKVKPKNVDHCRFDVQYFLAILGMTTSS